MITFKLANRFRFRSVALTMDIVLLAPAGERELEVAE